MSIQKRLAKFPVPEQVWDEYHLDQEINDRGIMLDMTVVQNAIAFDEKSKSALMLQMQNLTGLNNPNSVVQMKEWLSDNGIEAESLGKKEAKNMLPETDGDIKEALTLRLQLAKSSVKKYQAMQNAVCKDGRAHGMFQFYGANRSSRWAGRLIQLQNLPQNHMNDLAEARAIVRSGDYDTMQLLYDDIPDALSQLIRTAFIARNGYKFIVSDFSAIEAAFWHSLLVKLDALRYSRKENISTVPPPARCSAFRSKSMGLTVISVRKVRSQNWLSDTAAALVL